MNSPPRQRSAPIRSLLRKLKKAGPQTTAKRNVRDVQGEKIKLPPGDKSYPIPADGENRIIAAPRESEVSLGGASQVVENTFESAVSPSQGPSLNVAVGTGCPDGSHGSTFDGTLDAPFTTGSHIREVYTADGEYVYEVIGSPVKTPDGEVAAREKDDSSHDSKHDDRDQAVAKLKSQVSSLSGRMFHCMFRNASLTVQMKEERRLLKRSEVWRRLRDRIKFQCYMAIPRWVRHIESLTIESSIARFAEVLGFTYYHSFIDWSHLSGMDAQQVGEMGTVIACQLSERNEKVHPVFELANSKSSYDETYSDVASYFSDDAHMNFLNDHKFAISNRLKGDSARKKTAEETASQVEVTSIPDKRSAKMESRGQDSGGSRSHLGKRKSFV